MPATANESAACQSHYAAAINDVRGANAPAVNPAANFDSAWSMIALTHWDTSYIDLNWRAVHDSLRPKAADAKTVGELRAVLTTMLGTLKQSHFVIIPSDRSVSRDGVGSAGRSGIIGATVRDVRGALVVTAVQNGGAAARAGIRPGYLIETIDGCPLAPRFAQISRNVDERRSKLQAWRFATTMLNGPVGDTVQITARDERGNVRPFAIARESQPGDFSKFGNLQPLGAKLDFYRKFVKGKTVGVISFNVWSTMLSKPFAAAMDSLRNADAIVIDLRGNSGGVATMSQSVAGHFVDSALTLGTMFMRGITMNYDINPQRVNTANQRVQPFAGPVAVIVDELSASTSEVFAAGMQFLGRARLFGAQTAGEVLMAVTEKLPNGDFLNHAVGNYLLPNGKPLEGSGVTPDVEVSVSRAALFQGGDPALDEAAAWAASAPKPKPRAKLARNVPQLD
ncbi:MAG: S41 family peptidase [Gemmatimonadaceae bacterium]